MAKIYGFVAEFNPFHNGHKQFIDQIRKKYHPDVLIAVMSGNFVQRGDFAVLNKHLRAQTAVENGVDLVVELPFVQTVQPANIFAESAIQILRQIGITDLVFGTEAEMDFPQLARRVIIEQMEFKQDFTHSYAENLHQQLLQIGVDTANKPNQLLGLNYTTAIEKKGYPIKVHSLLRTQDGFSATKIRQSLGSQDWSNIVDMVPQGTYDLLRSQKIITWNDFYPFLRYKILTNTTNELQLMYQMVEGLNFKLKKEISRTDDFEKLLFSVKSKRYTLARIRRLLMYVLINVDNKEMISALTQTYLRILGFSHTGQQYLHQQKKNFNIPLITKVGQSEHNLMNLELRADSVYQLVNHEEQNFGVIPYIKGEN